MKLQSYLLFEFIDLSYQTNFGLDTDVVFDIGASSPR